LTPRFQARKLLIREGRRRKPFWQLARKARRQVRSIGGTNSNNWHDLRITLKYLRYALEFLASLLPHKRLNTYLATLIPVLEKLGQLNDLDTARLR